MLLPMKICRPLMVSASVVCVLALAGCSFFDEKRPGQQVIGSRHVPILNQGMVKQKSGVPGYSPAVTQGGAPETLPAVAATDDPYSQFDDQGKKISNKTYAPSAALKPSAPLAEEAYTPPTMQDNGRKPVMGNYKHQAESTVSMPPAPVTLELPPEKSRNDGEPKVVKSSKGKKNQSAETSKKTAAKTKAVKKAEEPVAEPVTMEEEHDGTLPSLAPLKSSTNTETQGAYEAVPLSEEPAAPVQKVRPAAATRDTSKAAYPKVSAVPLRPARMQQVRENSAENIAQMQQSREAAAQEKQVVDSEPSEISPSAPVPLLAQPTAAAPASVSSETSSGGEALPSVMMLKTAQ